MSSDTGTLWGNLGYIGELYTASPKETPFLSAIGTLNNGGKITANFEFPVSNQYSLTAAAQTTITENALDSAPTNTDYALTQYKNVCEQHYKGVIANYHKLESMGRISGVATFGETMTLEDIIAYDIQRQLEWIATQVEFGFTQGTYAISTAGDVANATRGLIECASNASNTVSASSAALSKDMLRELFRTMFANGARFRDPAVIVNAFQLQQLTDLYAFAPTDRTIGGVALQQILFDIAGMCTIMLSPQQPAATLTVVDLAVCSPVFQQVPGHDPGIFYEEYGRTAAAISGQLYGSIGLDHGPYFCHGTITSLSTS